jgi:Skp family chaperone for outer membrane proteins
MNVSEMLNNLDAVDDSVSNISMGFNARGSDLGESWGQNEDEGQLRDFIKRQKMQIKKMQEDLANKKKQYQADKASNENIRLSDPELYRMKI